MTIAQIHELFLSSTGVSTDTRNIKNKSLFFALKGENFNGNTFATNAIEQGANYAIVDEALAVKNNQCILVDDVLKTLQNLANYHRTYLNLPIIALTGSNGKTTTKELIHAVLRKKFNTVATKGNLNNHIGVPLTLLSMDKTTEIGIVEMGANHLKEIELLASIAAPNYGYITNFGKAHLEGFGGIEGVIKGKTELYKYLEKHQGKVFVNTADTLQIQHSQNIENIPFTTSVQLKSSRPFVSLSYDHEQIQTNLIGSYNFANIVAAITIGAYFSVSKTDIINALESYTPTNNRSQILKKGEHNIILDAYNANPSSMKVALENFNGLQDKHKTLVLGDMFELGETSLEEHQAIVQLTESFHFDAVYFVGENFAKTKTSKAVQFTSFEAFKNSFKATTPSTYLIKGSRGMALERTLDLFD
ncbi:UDP-N-acetylmuramoyl-tripeptide--D-alanyl-D-alanine ligase [Flavicella sediminum]|uniref:UDP-N-acetylmuramoyl-tripeptide--D-alanyl-D- alanine ligase n=1 Tax=Flavicella sediminum TaxID=2585141 RepID=UPI001120DD4C|nr:UDP-N-acetylmuramoyl-tripeptide--D-alanyl-D-alanine ligase [Flavicella sediminum]